MRGPFRVQRGIWLGLCPAFYFHRCTPILLHRGRAVSFMVCKLSGAAAHQPTIQGARNDNRLRPSRLTRVFAAGSADLKSWLQKGDAVLCRFSFGQNPLVCCVRADYRPGQVSTFCQDKAIAIRRYSAEEELRISFHLTACEPVGCRSESGLYRHEEQAMTNLPLVATTQRHKQVCNLRVMMEIRVRTGRVVGIHTSGGAIAQT